MSLNSSRGTGTDWVGTLWTISSVWTRVRRSGSRRVQLSDQQCERHFLMIERLQNRLSRANDDLLERGIAREIRTQNNVVDEATDEVFVSGWSGRAKVHLPRNRLPAVVVQERLVRGQQRHERRRPGLFAEVTDGHAELRRQRRSQTEPWVVHIGGRGRSVGSSRVGSPRNRATQYSRNFEALLPASDHAAIPRSPRTGSAGREVVKECRSKTRSTRSGSRVKLYRPAVVDDVVPPDQHRVLTLAQLQQFHTQQRADGQIDRPFRLRLGVPPQFVSRVSTGNWLRSTTVKFRG